MSDLGWPARYEITVGGALDDPWSAWFEGMSITTEGGRTVLSGVVADEAALHGLMTRVRDLGLPLISVCRRGDDRPEGSGSRS